LVNALEESAMSLVETAKLTVDGLLARRRHLVTREDRIQHALGLVQMHFESENPERIDECIRLYTEDAEWEAPARLAKYRGQPLIKSMYVRLFAATADFEWHPIERWATEDRVFDDAIATFRLTGDGFENAPFPIGTKVHMRLTHNFHIRDGLICKEIGYEVWRRDQ
jgi:SnoaL-like domain